MNTPTLPLDLLSSLPPEVVSFLDSQAKRIVELEALIADLQARLGLNSSNSSKPPSSVGPHVKSAPPKAPSGKRPGDQPGHARHERPRREPTRIIDVRAPAPAGAAAPVSEAMTPTPPGVRSSNCRPSGPMSQNTACTP